MDYKEDIFYIKEVLAGKINAFAYLIDKHKDNAFNLALRICGNREEAEEIAQDAFLKAYRSLGKFQMRSSFNTWLYRIVYNTAISLVRTRKNSILAIEDFPASAIDFLIIDECEDKAEYEYRNSLVNFALQKIGEEERALISLHYFNELDTEAISKITGISKSNVKVRLFRARKKIAEIIRKVEKQNTYCHEQAGSE
jgi:RNA polymerase sigma-70 factor (ECF subfamily)